MNEEHNDNQEEKNSKGNKLFIIIITVLITLIICTFGFSIYIVHSLENKKLDSTISSTMSTDASDNQLDLASESSSKMSSSSSTIDSNTSTSSSEKSVNQKKLEANQVESWVISVLNVSPYKDINYTLVTTINQDDHLVYTVVKDPTNAEVVNFRINAHGNLEIQESGSDDWEVISTTYLDTRIATAYFDKKN